MQMIVWVHMYQPCLVLSVSGFTQLFSLTFEPSLVPRPSHCSIFDCLGVKRKTWFIIMTPMSTWVDREGEEVSDQRNGFHVMYTSS